MSRILWLSFISLWACDSEDTLKVYNTDPTAVITSHVDGEEFLEGYEITFVGQVQDDNHASSSLTVQWSTDVRTLCEDSQPDASGATTCRAALEEGDSQVKLQVTDPEGSAYVTTIDISIIETGSPQITLISPTIEGAYYSDQLVHLSAIVDDNEDEPQDLQYTWESTLDGPLALSTPIDSDGTIDGYINLTAGQHAISLRVEDSSGKVSTESVAITVGGPNNDPTCDIITPESASTYVLGQNIFFSGTADDDDINNSMLAIIWESDQDGVLNTSSADTDGTLGFNTNTLNAGNHTISLRVEDEVGGLCQTSVQVLVGTPPQLTVSSPTSGAILSANSSISFSASVSDQEDIPSNLDVSWESDIDGVFSTQGANSNGNISFSTSNLSIGEHNITVTATDSAGLTDSTSFPIRINTPPTAPVVSITPEPADANDDLLAIASGSTDDDGDMISYAYEWYKNGVITSYTTVSVPNSATSTGDIWMVRVTPNDGYTDGSYTEISTTILNSAPQFDSAAAISPNTSIFTGTALTCTASASDLDDGVLAVSYSWSVGGVQIATGASYTVDSGNTNTGDSVICTATAIDSDGEVSTSTDSIIVENTTPVVDTPTLSSNVIYNDDIITCSAFATDPDESLVPTYEWSIGSVVVGTGNSMDLATTAAMPSDTLSCTASVTDSSSDTATSFINEVISNRSPSAPIVDITPTNPIGGQDDITCSIITASTDLDGQSISYTYSWEVDGTSTSYTTDIIPGADTIPSEEWVCSVVASDGIDLGSAGTATVIIAAEDSDGDGVLDDEDMCPGYDDFLDGNSNGIPDGCEVSLSFSFTGGMQTWTVPSDVTMVSFTAYGAQGSNGSGGDGGLGAIIQGTFEVTPGDTYDILVGEQSLINYGTGGHNGNSTGGGGGTFVALNSTPIIIAGGGGGGGYVSGGTNASLTEDGAAGLGPGGASGGSSGNGGLGDGGHNSGRSGAGFYSDGGYASGDGGVYCNACSSVRSLSFLNGGTGGPQGPHHGSGGYGGGGCGGNYGGGGGGGFSGGGGGSSNGYGGGGGGSYNPGTSPSASTGNTGNGSLVIITLSTN